MTGGWHIFMNSRKGHYFRAKDKGTAVCRKWMAFKAVENMDPRPFEEDLCCKACLKAYKKDLEQEDALDASK